MSAENFKHIERFSSLSKDHKGPIPYSIDLGDTQSTKKVFICSAIHGNEVGSIPAVNQFINDVLSKKISLNCHLRIALGNIEAIKLNVRYVEEDLNRSFALDDPQTIDAKRAKELSELILWSDIFLDLHQTIEETQDSFYVLRPHLESEAIARALSLSEYAIIIDDLKAEKKDKVTATSFGVAHGKASITLELSQKGYSQEAESLAYKAIYKLINLYQQNDLDTMSLVASKKPELKRIAIDYAQRFTSDRAHLVKGLKNLSHFKKGTLLGFDDEGEISAPFDGYIFFPKYPRRDESGKVLEALPTNLFLFGNKIK